MMKRGNSRRCFSYSGYRLAVYAWFFRLSRLGNSKRYTKKQQTVFRKGKSMRFPLRWFINHGWSFQLLQLVTNHNQHVVYDSIVWWCAISL